MNIHFELIEQSQMQTILPLFHELDPSIPIHILETRLSDMLKKGYECVGIYDGSRLIGMCGIWELVKYYVGKHIEPDNVYIQPEFQGLGIGKQLEAWLQNFALSRGCVAIELNCYLKNESGRKFWEMSDYQALAMHYQKKLSA